MFYFIYFFYFHPPIYVRISQAVFPLKFIIFTCLPKLTVSIMCPKIVSSA
jgi:hypothetical protein